MKKFSQNVVQYIGHLRVTTAKYPTCDKTYDGVFRFMAIISLINEDACVKFGTQRDIGMGYLGPKIAFYII